jgi:DNA helicase-2/ATP-dependent DNA helicase PcrA
VRRSEFDPSQILAVTFTDKAAGELKRRLQALGVEGVEARTFHSAAMSQLSRLWSSHTGEPLPEALEPEGSAHGLAREHLAAALPRRELAGEIEWAKNRTIPPARYLAELGDHEPPIRERASARPRHADGGQAA